MVNKIGVDDVLGWFKAALDVGGRNPRATFGAAALQLVVVFVVVGVAMLALAALVAVLGKEAALPAVVAGMLVLVLVSAVLTPVLGGGMVQVVDDAEAGRATSPLVAFAGFRRGRFAPLAGLALIALAGTALSLLNNLAFGGADYLRGQVDLWQALSEGRMMEPPQPAMPLLMFLAGLVIGVVQALLQLLAVPLVQLGGRGSLAAIGDAFAALRRNPGSLLLAILLGFVAIIGVALVAMVVLALLGLLASVLPWLAVPLILVFSLLVAVVGMVVYYGFCRAAWRSLYTQDAPPPVAQAELAL